MMLLKDKQLQKSLQILHSNLLLVLIVYMLDVLYGRLVYLNQGILGLMIVIPAKIYVLSGIFGVFVEFVSGEEIVLKFNKFNQSFKELWSATVFLYVLPAIVYFFIVLGYFGLEKVSIFAVYAHSYIFIAYILALYVIKRKYIRTLNLKKRTIYFGLQNTVTLLCLLALQLFTFYLPYYLKIGDIEVSRFTFFGLNYMNFLIFIYICCVFINSYSEIEKAFTHEKEIYLINPMSGGIISHIASLFLRGYPPAFVVIKALTPKNYKFRTFNRLPFRSHYFKGNKLVAITCYTSNCDDAYRIAAEFKKRGSKVVMGGPHVTYVPQEALEYCDSVVIGETESVWAQVIKDYEQDSLKPTYKGSPLNDCHHLVYEELLNSPPEIIKDFLETSRGCKFKCHFCSVPSLSEGKMRTAKIFEVVELIKKIKHKYKSVFFIDNNIYSDPGYAKELFEQLKSLNIKWSTQCSIDIAKNKEMLKLAKEAGCEALLIGFEVAGHSDEKKQGGKLAMADNFSKYAKNVKKAGIRIKAHFIFGFESDTIAHLWRMWKFCFTIWPMYTVLSFLTPYPGTVLYDEMIKEDRIRNLNWQHYGMQRIVFQHQRINNNLFYQITPFFTVFFLFTTSFLGCVMFLILLCSLMGITPW